MGRAYEVRKASIQKTGAAKAKLYSMYAREIYKVAKQKGTEVESNAELKRIIEKAKKEQVPSDIIKRAIDKVNSGVDESYLSNTYELFGPSGSTIIAECLTDNVNRTVSDLRTALNKCHCKMGNPGSVSYLYDHNSILSFKGLSEEETMDILIENDLDITDIENEENVITIYGNPLDLIPIKEILIKNNIEDFIIDEVSYLPKEQIELSKEDNEIFEKLIGMLDEVEDVQNIYHNVKNG